MRLSDEDAGQHFSNSQCLAAQGLVNNTSEGPFQEGGGSPLLYLASSEHNP